MPVPVRSRAQADRHLLMADFGARNLQLLGRTADTLDRPRIGNAQAAHS